MENQTVSLLTFTLFFSLSLRDAIKNCQVRKSLPKGKGGQANGVKSLTLFWSETQNKHINLFYRRVGPLVWDLEYFPRMQTCHKGKVRKFF